MSKYAGIDVMSEEKFTVEKHGDGWSIYVGRSDNYHGYNAGHLSECGETLAKLIQESLNLHWRCTHLETQDTENS
jgi:hypothetical protein